MESSTTSHFMEYLLQTNKLALLTEAQFHIQSMNICKKGIMRLDVFPITVDSRENEKQFNTTQQPFSRVVFDTTPQHEPEQSSDVGIFSLQCCHLSLLTTLQFKLRETTKGEIKWKTRQLCATVQMT